MSNVSTLKDRRHLLLLGCAFILGGLIVLAGMSLTASSQDGDVVAVVNGEPITREEFFERLQEAAGEQILDQIILEKVIAQAEGNAGVTVSEEELQEELAGIKESFASDEEFEAELSRYGLTLERLLYEIRLNLILTKLSRKDVTVTDEEIASFFEENKQYLHTPLQIKVRHILVASEEEAKEIVAQLKEGTDFAELARAKSIDTASGVQGGEIGFIDEDSPIVEEFKTAAFALAVGEVSDPVKSQFGWHIIRVDERVDAVEATLENTRDWIEEYLISQKARPVGDVVTELRSGAKVEVNWARYQSLSTGAASE